MARTARIRPGTRAASARPGSPDDRDIADDLQEQLLEGRTPRGEVVEANALRGQPARHLRQVLLAVDAQTHEGAVLTQVTTETSQCREDLGRRALQAQLDLEVPLRDAQGHF